jgi:hypothetical protein
MIPKKSLSPSEYRYTLHWSSSHIGVTSEYRAKEIIRLLRKDGFTGPFDLYDHQEINRRQRVIDDINESQADVINGVILLCLKTIGKPRLCPSCNKPISAWSGRLTCTNYECEENLKYNID